MSLRALFGLELLMTGAAVNTHALGRTTRPDGVLLIIPLATRIHGGKGTPIIGQILDLSLSSNVGEVLPQDPSLYCVETAGTHLHLSLRGSQGIMVTHGR